MRGNSNKWVAIFVIFFILLIDQVIKIYIKSTMFLGQSIQITNWFYIDFVENIGMAFGINLLNKFVLSLFRLIAIAFLFWYLKKIVLNSRVRYVVFISLILAGAIGNMIDPMFYGLLFSESTPYQVASFVPFGTGYSSFLMGKVVDMFYFPLIQARYPSWFPICGGEEFVFFRPVFNIADASISVGVLLLFLFCRKELENLSFTFRLNKKTSQTNEEKK